tara:strand:+ start:2322 stop:3731 length:1410 start_codon:yes stop_codon:yes gene_type:complete
MPSENIGKLYYVSIDGMDYKGDGSISNPWRNIEFAISQAKDLSTIIVKPGVYVGTTRVKKTFNKGLLIKSEFPYLAKLTHNARILAIVGNAKNITIEGFEFTHNTEAPHPVLVHIDGYGSYGTPKTVSNITLRNNILHDSFNNDLLKINNGAKNIKVHCNMFYNQGDSDEHIDVNSVTNVDIADNIFFNDFPASNRKITKKSSSFIVVKDSNDHEDKLIGAKNINIHRNVFFNWQGSHGHGFILIGEDGKPYYEADGVNIYNNLFLGNSPISMRSPLGIKGAKNIRYFNNTISGDLPSNAYALRANRENKNQINDNIELFNNIWADPTGTMGQGEYESTVDFSDTLPNQVERFILHNNLVFNGGLELPYSLWDKINPKDDIKLTNQDPMFRNTTTLVSPVWQANKSIFADGSFTIRNAFLRIVLLYGVPENIKAITQVIDNSEIPSKDILGKKRSNPHSLGAYSINNTN